MASASRDPNHQQPQSTTGATLSAEEEALKRNTDCVYFLASPLTCKKGSECEYRHSEYARVNPRDCWFWLNGNCLNPKCSFRHPPLDGLLGTQVTTPAASSLAPSLTPTGPTTHTPYNSGKQSVPCIFFQKGMCSKGDFCSFLHGPKPNNNKPLQLVTATSGTESQSQKKPSFSLGKCNQEQKIPQINISKSGEAVPQSKPVAKFETSLLKNEVGTDKSFQFTVNPEDELPRYRSAVVPLPVTNGSSVNFHNDKDADESLRESSPGFDVLVDDERGDSDYYHNDDRFGRPQGNDNEYDYNSMADVDSDIYRDPRGYDSYERMQDHYGYEQRQRRASSERRLSGASHMDRRGQVDELDLRNRLSKHRKVNNGLRSVINSDYPRDNYRGYSHRESNRSSPSHESSISSRLQGRIKLPVNGNESRGDREIETGRNRGRFSQERLQNSSHQGRLRDRIKGKLNDDFINEGRNYRVQRMKRDIMDDKDTNFTGPKSLAELKGVKDGEKGQQSISVRKERNHSEGDVFFEGPKPLSEILKRKRGAEGAASGTASKEYNNREGSKEVIKEESKSGTQEEEEEENGLIVKEKHSTHGESEIGNENDNEEGLILEDNQVEAFEQRENYGDSDYEHVDDGAEYDLDEGANADPEEEYVEDDDDADDFAKKMGVMFS